MDLGEYSQTYQVYEKVGSGSGGTVYKGYHISLQKQIALKKIHESGTYDLEFLRRESNILKELRHSYLPQVFDFLVLESGVYTVMDFISGKSLKEMMDEGHHFTEKEIVKYGTQLCEVLAYLHSHNPVIIHGDIKPANIMITLEGNVCLIDFNISGAVGQDHNAYVFGCSEGYAAPEQYDVYLKLSKMLQQAEQNSGNSSPQGKSADIIVESTGGIASSEDKTVVLTENMATALLDEKTAFMSETEQTSQVKGIPVDTRSDVYSLAATLYHMLTGQTVSQSAGGTITADASDGFCMILNKALAINPDKRYQDAGEMLSAFRNIYKLDRRYRRIVLGQQLLECLFILLIVAGTALILMGRQRRSEERQEQYQACLEILVYDRENKLEDDFIRIFEQAKELYPDRLEAYYQRALYLFEQKEYRKGIEYINTYVLTRADSFDEVGLADVFYLLGRNYFELGDYGDAVEAYQKAISYDASKSDAYNEYAITLARIGELDKAQEVLEQVQDMNVNAEMMYLIQGEIAKALGEDTKACGYLMQCAELAADSYVKLRAFIICSDIYDGMELSEEHFQSQIEILEKAKVDLPFDYQPMVLQRLAQAYISYADYTDDTELMQSAIRVLEQIAESGWADFTVYSNIAVLYQKSGDLDGAETVLQQMETVYSDHYALYKRKAFLEFERQYRNTERDFSKFLEYYNKAVELYGKSGITTDMEMQVLEQEHEQLVELGVL